MVERPNQYVPTPAFHETGIRAQKKIEVDNTPTPHLKADFLAQMIYRKTIRALMGP